MNQGLEIRPLIALTLSALALTTLAASGHAQFENPAAFPLAGTGAAGVGGFGGGIGGPGPGAAPPSSSDLQVLNASAGIPVGGALLISASWEMPLVAVTDTSAPSTTLGGTLAQLEQGGQLWTWTPTTPWIEGHTYDVQLSSPSFGFSGIVTTFGAVPAVTITKPELEGTPSLSLVEHATGTACCRGFFGSGFLEQTTCFPSTRTRMVELTPGLSSSASALMLNQLVFRLTSTESGSALVRWPMLGEPWFTVQADSYCFTLQAIDFASGTVFDYGDDDFERCVPHGDLPALGVEPIEPGPGELTRLACPAPPFGYEDAWCEVNEAACAGDEPLGGCELYGHVCRREPLPPDPFVNGAAGSMPIFGTSGIGGVGGIGGPGTAATGGAGGLGGSSEDSGGSSGGGCAIARAPRSGGAAGSAAPWLAALALAGIARARRRRHE